jgi:putative tricarboxylic transport membrane protein
MKVRSQTDLWAGLMFIAFGFFFMLVAGGTPEFLDRIAGQKLVAGYQMGSALRMGPAYFPVVLGGMLAVLGLAVLIDSMVEAGPDVPQFHLRPLLLVLAGCLAFAYTLKPLGLVGASLLLVFISAFGGHEFRWKEVLFLSLALIVFSVAVFVKALALPFPIWPDADEIRRALGSRPAVPQVDRPAADAPKKKIGEK